jgi:hypothetical protein
VSSKLRLSKHKALPPGALGPLTTPADAQHWSRLLAEAVAEGRITPAQGNSANRAVETFLRGRDLEQREGQLSDLLREMKAMKATMARQR